MAKAGDFEKIPVFFFPLDRLRKMKVANDEAP
jgi:hypothetical protein